MDLGIRGRKALINGASAGLGLGTALALANEGVELFISARGKDRLLAACASIARTGAAVTPIVADHSTDEGREQILKICPDPDILVGTCSPPKFVQSHRNIARQDWQQTLDTGLLSPVMFIEAVIGRMTERGWGRIVNIAAGAAKFPSESRILSGAPRAALVNYSVALSKLVAKHNVIINTLLPIMHDTAGIREVLPTMLRIGTPPEAGEVNYEKEMARVVDQLRIPAGRFGAANDFGSIAAMFCSEFANYVTGQSLVVDGGLTNSIF